MFGLFRREKPKSDLEERIEKLERGMRDIRTDWDSVFEKFAKLYARLHKRARREFDEAEIPAQDAPQPTIAAEDDPNLEAMRAITRMRIARR